MSSTIRNNLSLYDFLAANRPKLRDQPWLEETLRPHCKIKRMRWRGSRLRILQFPAELSQWLVFMAERNVKSYLEIGTSTGGSFFTTDSYLRAAVPGFAKSVGYDRTAKLRDWPDYQARFPSCEFRHQPSHKMNLGNEQFDVAFIDARHIEKWVLHDFEKVRHNARFVAFHDIALHGSSVYLAWEQIKRGRTHWDFIDQTAPVEARCGIGVVAV